MLGPTGRSGRHWATVSIDKLAIIAPSCDLLREEVQVCVVENGSEVSDGSLKWLRNPFWVFEVEPNQKDIAFYEPLLRQLRVVRGAVNEQPDREKRTEPHGPLRVLIRVLEEVLGLS